MENFIAGAFGGLACVAAGQPLDTIKKTLVEERLRGFYAGAVPAVVSNVAENAVLFLCYNHCQTAVQWAFQVESRADMSVHQRSLAGSLASIFSAAAISPCELIKCKMQTSRMNGLKYSMSPIEAVKVILREEGVMGMYRGLTSTWAREVPGYFGFFTAYNASIKFLTPEEQTTEKLSIWRTALAGGLAGCGFWGFVFPFDSVKSRIQVRGEYSNSLMRSLIEIVRNEGVRVLYRGLLPTIIRSFPANGALFVIYELTMELLQRR